MQASRKAPAALLAVVALVSMATLGALPSADALHCCPPPPAPPGPPKNLQANAGQGQVSLAWAPPDAQGVGYLSYIISRTSGSTTQAYHAQVDGSVLSFTDAGLLDGATFTYRVRGATHSNHMDAEGGNSNAATATTFKVPAAPTALATAAGPGAGTMTLAWALPSDTGGTPITAVRVYKAPAKNDIYALAAELGAGATSFSEPAPPAGAQAWYKVAAANIVGEGPKAGPVLFPTSKPSMPLDLAATTYVSSFGVDGGWVQLGWNPPASDGGFPVTQYRVYRGTSPSAMVYYAYATTTAFHDVFIAPGATYYYKVSAVNSLGEGPGAGPACVRPYFALGPACAA